MSAAVDRGSEPNFKEARTRAHECERILRPWLVALLILAMPLAVPAHPRDPKNLPSKGSTGINTEPDAAVVPRARIETRPVSLPIVDRNDIRFERLTTAQGLSQTQVGHMVQDDQRFLWFGTQYGLNRYDGYKFRVFKHEPDQPNSLSGVFVYSLFKDRSGNLWVGCDQNVDRFDPVTEEFKHYHLDQTDPEHLPVTVVHISQDHNGILWLSTGSGLYGLDPAKDRLFHYQHDPEYAFSLSGNDVKSSGEDREGTFWVATSEGLDRFDRETGKVTLHVPLHEERELSFYEDRTGVFWILYASGNGLAVLDRSTSTLTRYTFYNRARPSSALTGVLAMLEDQEGNLWLGSQANGLLKLDREHHRFVRYRSDAADSESLTEDRVHSLLEDREGNIWIGLGERGANVFLRKHPKFESFGQYLGHAKMRGETLVNTIYEDHQGIVWVGSGVALTRIDRVTRRSTLYLTSGPEQNSDVITILGDSSGRIWAGTYGQGLKRFDPRTGHFKSYWHDLDDPSSLSGNIVTRLLIDHAHTMWVATTDGLNRFDPGTGHFDVYKAKGQDRSPFYLDLAEDHQGRLWLGSLESGLQRFDSATGEFKIYKHDSDDVGSLSNNRVNSVHIDRSGAMWIGTQNGLDKFDPTTETFTTFYERDGLGGNVVGCVLEDGHGKLWMSTNKGISRFDPAKGTFQNYSDSDGLPGADLTGWGACNKSPSGEMLFGGFSGATAFFPDEIADSAASPSVVLTDFRLTGAHVDVGAGSPLQQSITFLPALTLSHRQNIFSLEFSTLSYLSPATNRYRYRLQGLNDDWIYTDSDHRYASYTTLPPGVYEFRVQAATSRGSWSEPGAALRIEILPPWWSTWWFRALYGVAILLIAVAAYRYRMVRMARQFNARMEERVDERTRIAQDLHDTLLQGLLSASMQLHVADDQMPPNSPAKPLVGRVLALMKQVIDEGRNAVRGLRSATAEARSLEEAFSKVPQAMGMQGDIDLRVIVEGQPQALHAVVRDEVHRIGREALVNAFRHSHANRIEVELEYATQSLRMCVRDDGVGIKAEMLRSGREGHWGLEGMRERAERIGAKLRVWSHASAGTEVELTVPGSIAFESSSIEGASMWIGRRRGRNMQSDLTKQEKAS